jgi:hypothetical protein
MAGGQQSASLLIAAGVAKGCSAAWSMCPPVALVPCPLSMGKR